jgi:hypothetical protein
MITQLFYVRRVPSYAYTCLTKTINFKERRKMGCDDSAPNSLKNICTHTEMQRLKRKENKIRDEIKTAK